MITVTSTLTTGIYGELIELDRALKAVKANRHDRVSVLIEACILNGIDSGPFIVHTLNSLGFDKRHVGIMLDQNSGKTSAAGRWFRNAEGRYELHGPVKS